MKCIFYYWLAALQHIPCLHSAFDGNGTSLQHQPTSLNRFCAVFLALTQLRYRYTIVAWQSPAQQVGCLCLSSHLYMASIITHCRSCVHAVPRKLHFTLRAIAMLIVRSWIVHLTQILCSLFHSCPNLAMLPHYV